MFRISPYSYFVKPMYNVQLPKFEGPLDLLLRLIEEQKLDITEVSIAQVAEDYLEYVRTEENISLENLSEFLDIASKIILIKSRNILPTIEITPDEEKEIKDLEEQLREYKKYKDAACIIGERFGKNPMRSRKFLQNTTSVFAPPKNLNSYDLKKQFQNIVSQIILPEKISKEAVQDIVTLEEKINELQKSLSEKMEMSFSQIRDRARDRVGVIVSFLALLELVKQRIVSVEQNNLFEEMRISKNTNNDQETHG